MSSSQQDLADQIQSVYPGESLVLTPAAHCFRFLRHPKRADTRTCVSLARDPRLRLQSRPLLNYEPLFDTKCSDIHELSQAWKLIFNPLFPLSLRMAGIVHCGGRLEELSVSSRLARPPLTAVGTRRDKSSEPQFELREKVIICDHPLIPGTEVEVHGSCDERRSPCLY